MVHGKKVDNTSKMHPRATIYGAKLEKEKIRVDKLSDGSELVAG
jgi:hypothetical protein